jgi:hypothetical protein
MWLIAAHGLHADYVNNILARSGVRLRHGGRWRSGTAAVHRLDPTVLTDFNGYARSALRVGIDPQLIRVDYQ